MKTHQDVERAITDWLNETAVRRAPDRVLEEAHRTIDATKQRRRAAWRDHVSSMPKLIAAGLAVVAIAFAGGLIGRSTAGVGTATSASPEPSVATIASYRTARNAICAAAQPAKDALSERYELLFESRATDAQRVDGIAAMEEFIDVANQVTDDLSALDPPADLAAAHAANVTQYRDVIALLRHMVGLQKDGRFADAVVVSATTEAITLDMEAFERVNQLTACP